MNKCRAILSVLLFVVNAASAQFYLLDHVNQKESSQNFRKLVELNIKSVSLSSINREGEADPDFFVEQKVDAKAGLLVTKSKGPGSPSSMLSVYFDAQYRPVQNIDSVDGAKTTVHFYYNSKTGWLDSAVSKAVTSLQDYTYMEKREYLYDKKGNPDQMLWIRNGTDTTYVLFDAESAAKPEVERWYKKAVSTETFYYYYDDRGNLTDLVKLYKNVDRLLPLNTFTYDDEEVMVAQTNFLPGSNDYTIYQYTYDDNGLRTAESVFNKAKQQIGRVVYTYIK